MAAVVQQSLSLCREPAESTKHLSPIQGPFQTQSSPVDYPHPPFFLNHSRLHGQRQRAVASSWKSRYEGARRRRLPLENPSLLARTSAAQSEQVKTL